MWTWHSHHTLHPHSFRAFKYRISNTYDIVLEHFARYFTLAKTNKNLGKKPQTMSTDQQGSQQASIHYTLSRSHEFQ